MNQPPTIYITAQKVMSDLQNPEGLNAAAIRLRDGRFGRVVLESYRGGVVVDEAQLRAARDFFIGQGFATMGGLMPVHGNGFGKLGQGIEIRGPFFCYTAEETVSALETEIRKLSRLFDCVVIDDAFLTACRCAACEQRRGAQDWFSFRRDLLCSVARRWVAAAHEEKPKVRLVIKFPQYYDRHHRFGYDAERFPEIFDAVWVGTETRDPDTLAYGYVEPYQGYVNGRWMRACAGDKFDGAWFDYLDCDEQLFYEQGVTTYLAAPRNVTVFCYGEGLFAGSKMNRLADAAPTLERLRDIAVDPWGVHVLKPPNSDGGRDLFIFDYLGMLGVPCVPTTRLHPSMRSVFVPAHGMVSAETPARVRDVLASGGHVILTFDALCRGIEQAEFLGLFGYDAPGIARAVVRAEQFEIARDVFRPARPIHLGGDLEPADASVMAWGCLEGCERGTIRIPLLTVKTQPSGGKAVVWNIGTFNHDAFQVNEQLNVPVQTDLFALPKAVLDALRATATDPLGFRVEALARVACFLFSRYLVLVNYSSSMREVHTAGLNPVSETLLADSANTVCTGDDFLLAPRSFAAVEIRPDRDSQ